MNQPHMKFLVVLVWDTTLSSPTPSTTVALAPGGLRSGAEAGEAPGASLESGRGKVGPETFGRKRVECREALGTLVEHQGIPVYM